MYTLIKQYDAHIEYALAGFVRLAVKLSHICLI
jgi:hypothetical protein